MKLLASVLIAAAFLAGCETTPKIVEKQVYVAVTLERSKYEVTPAPKPMAKDEYLSLDALERKQEDGKLILLQQKYIKYLRDRIESLWESSQTQKHEIERKEQ